MIEASPHEAIRNLLGRYCELMDAADWIGLGHLFADARLVDEHGTLVAEGHDGVQRLYERGTRLYDGSPRTRHITANTVIEVAQGGEQAVARSSYVVFQGTDRFALQPIITGRYRDCFELGAGGWHFTERCFYVDQLGDLSHHLTWELPT
jgi:3-phenylpropionate/cinnamic acid dioxygenase small subunit